MTESTPLYFKDVLAEFLLDPSKSTLNLYLANQLGEQPSIDFKEVWPRKEQLARHLLGMANSGGGVLIMGVAELSDKSISATGLTEPFKDGAAINEQLSAYLPTYLSKKIAVYNFHYSLDEDPKSLHGKRFQALTVATDAIELPYFSLKKIESYPDGTVFVRHGSKTTPANSNDRDELLKQRDQAMSKVSEQLELKGHLQQLRVLYGAISPTIRNGGPFTLQIGDSILQSLYGPARANPNYPDETFDDFVNRMIDTKKHRIQRELGL